MVVVPNRLLVVLQVVLLPLLDTLLCRGNLLLRGNLRPLEVLRLFDRLAEVGWVVVRVTVLVLRWVDRLNQAQQPFARMLLRLRH